MKPCEKARQVRKELLKRATKLRDEFYPLNPIGSGYSPGIFIDPYDDENYYDFTHYMESSCFKAKKGITPVLCLSHATGEIRRHKFRRCPGNSGGNPEQIERLRTWAAKFCDGKPIKLFEDRKTGIHLAAWQFPVGEDKVRIVESWLPDRPESGQIWMVVNRMKEKGWFLHLEYYITGLIEAGFLYKKVLPNRPPLALGTNEEPCLAILLAAYAAVEGKEFE